MVVIVNPNNETIKAENFVKFFQEELWDFPSYFDGWIQDTDWIKDITFGKGHYHRYEDIKDQKVKDFIFNEIIGNYLIDNDYIVLRIQDKSPKAMVIQPFDYDFVNEKFLTE